MMELKILNDNLNTKLMSHSFKISHMKEKSATHLEAWSGWVSGGVRGVVKRDPCATHLFDKWIGITHLAIHKLRANTVLELSCSFWLADEVSVLASLPMQSLFMQNGPIMIP